MSQRVLRISLVVVLVGGIGLAWWARDTVTPAAVAGWVEGLGIWGPLVFVGVYGLAPALFVPGAVLTLAGGALFGPLAGALLSLTGATAGATAAFLSLKTHHIQRREAFERNIQSFTYRTIMPWRAFEDAVGLSENAPECRYLVSYASGPDRYITVEKRLALEHMKHLVDDLRRYENYEIALVKDHPSVEDLLYTPWLVKGDVAVLTAIFTKSEAGQHSVFAAEFELTEASLVRIYQQEFLKLWDQVADPDKVRQKDNVIRELTKILERASG
jgi:hypothetical protein